VARLILPDGGRWGAEAARARLAPVEFFWRAMPLGLGIMTTVNAAQMAAFWHSYRHPAVAGCLMVSMACAAGITWRLMATGLGPVASAAAVLTGPAACAVMATQLPPQGLSGLANWTSGYSAASLVLLPFARPAEEWITGAVLLAATQEAFLRGLPPTARSLHALVLSAGAGPAIVAGAALYVSVLRRAVTQGQALRCVQRQRSWRQARIATLLDLQRTAISAAESAAAQTLQDVAAGLASCRDPQVMDTAGQLVHRLRLELRSHGARSLLQATVAAATQHFTCAVEVDDTQDLGARMPPAQRMALVDAIAEAAAGRPSGAMRVTVQEGSTRAVASVTIFGRGGPIPQTATWRTLLGWPDHHVTAAQPGRWFYDTQVPLLVPGGELG
jgi:hypothetical protein